MKPIDFPEKYENLMRVAQQALANQQYQQAKELFQRAYELKESFEANSLLVFCLYELDEKKEALKQALLHEKQYLQNEEFAEFYFDLLISTQDFLYARKLIASTDFYEALSSGSLKKSNLQKNYPDKWRGRRSRHSTINRRNFLRWNLHVSLRLLMRSNSFLIMSLSKQRVNLLYRQRSIF